MGTPPAGWYSARKFAAAGCSEALAGEVDLFGIFYGMKYGLPQFERQGCGGIIINRWSMVGI